MSSQITDPTGLIGVGLAWPIQLENGRARLSTGHELLQSRIAFLVNWPKGTRILMGKYGSDIFKILEEQNTLALQSLLRTFFNDAVELWETSLVFVDMEIIQDSATSVKVKYYYRVAEETPVESFVVPFYRNIAA